MTASQENHHSRDHEVMVSRPLHAFNSASLHPEWFAAAARSVELS
jgi:hypothetical protein